jgi:hypothetical protein
MLNIEVNVLEQSVMWSVLCRDVCCWFSSVDTSSKMNATFQKLTFEQKMAVIEAQLIVFKATDTCYQKCVASPTSMNERERDCVRRCAGKMAETSNLMSHIQGSEEADFD